jgi:hypothetical protein
VRFCSVLQLAFTKVSAAVEGISFVPVKDEDSVVAGVAGRLCNLPTLLLVSSSSSWLPPWLFFLPLCCQDSA